MTKRPRKPSDTPVRGWRACDSCKGSKQVVRLVSGRPKIYPCYACNGQGRVHPGLI